jgi:hypothetical protein
MTVDAARRTRRRAPAKSDAPEPTIAPPALIAIGEFDQTIFQCPSCARPLALGARRCPGCGTRMIAGVTLGKASGFIAAGVAVGMLLGAGGGFLVSARLAVAVTPASAAASAPPLTGSSASSTATPEPTATATPGPTATASSGSAGIPLATRTALVQVIGMNDRLATAEAGLRAALAARSFDSSEVAQILRSVSADSVFRQQIADRIAAWPESSAVGTQLATFYGSIHDTAANGLLASVQNRAAYRAAATTMIKLLVNLPAVDTAVRAAAESAGVDLP